MLISKRRRRGVEPTRPAPGVRAGGGAEVWGAGRAGRGWAGLREECQLIMSLLLTPYVEFFMLSFTSRLNTDKF